MDQRLTTDKGSGVLLGEPPVLEIEGQSYPLRKLGLMDMERLLVIVKKVSKSVDALQMTGLDDLTAEKGVQFFIDFMPYAFDEIVQFLATVIGLKPGIAFEEAEKKTAKSKAEHPADPNEGTIRDPNVFPLGSEIQLLRLLAEHPDVVRFFTEGRALKDLPILKKLIERSRKPSTESKEDTDGPTNMSLDNVSQTEASDFPTPD